MSAERRLLVVDDEEKVRFVLSRALRRLSTHYQIDVAADAAEALRLAEQKFYDLVITDLNLPGINGVELTERLLAQASGTAIIWITAYGCYQMTHRDIFSHVFACLEKPISIDEIRETALKALRQRDREQFSRTHSSSNSRHEEVHISLHSSRLAPSAAPD